MPTLCQSLVHTQGGVPKKHWDSLRREVLHTYGHEHILTLTTLQDAGEHLHAWVCTLASLFRWTVSYSC